MRIILHIGQQKTGSTSLQHSLVGDRRRLLANGILYPDVGHARGVHGGLRPSHNAMFHRFQGQTGRRAWQSTEEIREVLTEQIAVSDPKVLLLSAEHAFMASDQSRPILDQLDELIPGDKGVVVYLRRPDRYLTSFHKQLIRLGARGIVSLDSDGRIDQLASTCQIDHTRAIGAYADRYSDVSVFNYDEIDDVVAHFYSHVLGISKPAANVRYNPSIPSVLANLALTRLNQRGALNPHEIQTLLAFGERERVELIGTPNRQRLVEVYEPHNSYLGELTGREVLFEDLEEARKIDAGAISVSEADENYQKVFDSLMSGPTIEDLRRDCRILERSGQMDAASDLFAAHTARYSPEERAWFDADLRMATNGEIAVRQGRYVSLLPVPALTQLKRDGDQLARRAVRRVRSTVRRG
ncbi:MAG: hypothetical protein ACR2PK_13635 [Acidimicrobiales bacterium]